MLVCHLQEDGEREAGTTTLCYRSTGTALSDGGANRDTVLSENAEKIADRPALCNGSRIGRLLSCVLPVRLPESVCLIR
jgi:hypothetical protein